MVSELIAGRSLFPPHRGQPPQQSILMTEELKVSGARSPAVNARIDEVISADDPRERFAVCHLHPISRPQGRKCCDHLMSAREHPRRIHADHIVVWRFIAARPGLPSGCWRHRETADGKRCHHYDQVTIPKHPANVLVTKMVANLGPRVDIERDGSARAADFRNTNQHLSGQNETGRNGDQQISSAVLRPLSALSMAAKRAACFDLFRASSRAAPKR
jgi:hypothetical protein